MSDIKAWSATAANNNQAPPDGWPEGMAPSAVNNCAREDKAAIRRAYIDMQWNNPGGTPTYVSTSQFTIADNSEITDFTQFYIKGRRIRLVGSTPFTAYAIITSSSYVNPTTTVNFTRDPGYSAVDNTLTDVSFGILPKLKNSFPSSYPTNYYQGVISSMNTIDPDNDIDIASGNVRDALDFNDMSFAGMTKQLDANWVAGTNQGGFPSGLTLAATTTYRIFIIGKTDGTTDAGFDTSATAANLLADATGYVYYREIATVLTDGSKHVDTITLPTVGGGGGGGGGSLGNTIIRSTQVWTRPGGVTDVRVTVFGAGGGGGGGSDGAVDGSDGVAGGNSSFGAFAVANGGALGHKATTLAVGAGGNGGTGTGGDFTDTGNNGAAGVALAGGAGGDNYGHGGDGGTDTGVGFGGGGGGAGATVVKHIQGIGASVAVTIGTGGTGGAAGGTSGAGANGLDGACIIEYF